MLFRTIETAIMTGSSCLLINRNNTPTSIIALMKDWK